MTAAAAAAPVALRTRSLATLALVTAGMIALAAAAPARAQPQALDQGSSTSLRLTAPGGGLWLRGRTFGPTSPAETASLGHAADPSWRLLGSYDLPKAGLRASGGMIGVSRRTAFGGAALQESQRWDNGLTAGWIEGTRVQDTALQASHISVPYAGIGYSTASALSTGGPQRGLVSSTWSFSVDLGVMALAPRSSVRFGGADGSQSRLDDMLRELRLSPLLQLGVSYSF
jgi:hypothetical protein